MSLDLWIENVVTTRTQVTDDLNITHNLHEMAVAAGADPWDWAGKPVGDTFGATVQAMINMAKNPTHFKQFNPKNNWGNYDNLIEYYGDILRVSFLHPDGVWGVSK